ncbi:MAG: hypothetical protein ISS52_08420 [Dehalococcoidia bacterium]|nr:hypothetical protein [Dehalococcoidia bacterium]
MGTSPAAGCGQPQGQSEQEPSKAAEELRTIEELEFSETYYAMQGYVERAYTVALGLENFDWHPFDGFTWESPAEYGTESSALMSEVLPSAEAIEPLLMQCDKCNALAVEIWLERPLLEPKTTTQDTTKLTTGQWRALCRQLGSELAAAEREVAELKSDTERQFADIEHSLSVSTTSIQGTYLDRFRGTYAQYVGLFDQVTSSLEQAERLAVKLRCQHLVSPVAAAD